MYIEEAVFIMMLCGLWGLGIYALYQRFFVNRRLRKQIERYAEAILATASAPAPASASASASQQPATETNDFKRIQQRVEVLERIAVGKEDSLTREIEELRIASR